MNESDIKKLLPAVLVENLSAEKLSKLGEEFNRLVEAKVDERTQVAVKCAETAFNEEANAKLQKLVCQIDEAHKKAFLEAFDAICDSYEKELTRVKRFYNTKVKQDSVSFQKKLLEKVSDYIDENIDKALPTNQVRKAVKNVAAAETINSLRRVLNINEATANDEIRGSVMEAVDCIDKQIETNKKLQESNMILKKRLQKSEAAQYLTESTSNLPAEAKNFVRRVLKDADKKFIKENLNNVISQYKKNVESNRNALLEKTLAKRYNQPQKSMINNISRRRLLESASQKEVVEIDPEQAQINSIIEQCKSM